MDEKTLRALIETGSVKALHIIADGPLFHVRSLLPGRVHWRP
ncbi:MAG: hypothetical protein WCH04_01080 [Gammaproteobacteria bacterium]